MADNSPNPRPVGTWDVDRLWLFAVLVLGLALRIPMLNSSLWYDEIDTLVSYVRLPLGDLLTTYPSLNNHMFFSLQASLSISLFGESPWALRLPALLFGLGSLWGVWLLGREVLTRWEANFAALLMAVSYHHVWFSQNARGYTGLLFWGLLATWLMLRGIRDNRLGWWLAYGACFAASMYTHLSAAFLFFAHALVYFGLFLLPVARARQPLLNPLLGALFGIAVSVALYWPILDQVLATFTEVAVKVQSEAYTDSIAHFENPLWTMVEAISTLVGNTGLIVLFAPLIGIVLLVATGALLRERPLFALLFPVHLVVTLVLLKLAGMRVWPRYFLVDIGIICLLLIHGATVLGAFAARLSGRRAMATQIGLGFALIGIVASLSFLPKNYSAPKQDFAGASSWIESQRAPNAPVVALGLSAYPFQKLYAPDWKEAATLQDFETLTEGSGEAWVVYTFPQIIERRHANILTAMVASFKKVRYFRGTLAGGGIVVFRRSAG